MPVPADPDLHVASVTLRVADLERVLRFYRDVLGLELLHRDEDGARLGVAGELLVELDARVGPTAPAPRDGSTGLFHTAFLYPSRGALADVLARVAAARHPLTGASDHGVSEALYCHDPEGNGVELYHDLPRSGWPAPAPGQRVGMYSRPLDVEALLREARPGAAERLGEPGDPAVGIGHVHLKVAELARSVAFYRDVVGLDLMAAWEDQAGFLGAGGYHHHWGLNTWYSAGGAAPPPGSTGLARVTLGVPHMQALSTLRAALGSDGCEDDGVLARDPDGIALGAAVSGRNPTRQT